MLNKLLSFLYPLTPDAKAEGEKKMAKERERATRSSDPMDPMVRVARSQGWGPGGAVTPTMLTHADFPILELETERTGAVTLSGKTMAMDSAAVTARAYDNSGMGGVCEGPGGSHIVGRPLFGVPEGLANWYLTQTFIGHHACAIIAQHWLVDKACSQAGEDAVRNGWIVKAMGEEELSDENHEMIQRYDDQFNLKFNLQQFNRFKNIFGIRLSLFEVESDDEKYYEKPFNIDGVTPGSYKGISQIDPYWTMPMLTASSTSDPAAKHFYEPEYWIISGKKYHRSHLVIARAPEPADILKPTYLFGGIPLTQRIYERVYAAERTANEAPLLALNKRTTAIHVDMEKAVLNEQKFLDKLNFWVKYRDNHAVKVLGKEETMEQFDTNLTDFDSIIMNQFQLVAAISRTPSTKLLGTSPKGFNSTGEFETVSYHEELESIQEHTMDPMLARHYLLLEKSLELGMQIVHVWEPVDSVTAEKQALLNKTKAETGKTLVDSGAISPDEERNRVRDDKDSGYNRLSDADADETPGDSPENIAAMEKAGAAMVTGSARSAAAGVEPNPEAAPLVPTAAAPIAAATESALSAPAPAPKPVAVPTPADPTAEALQRLAAGLGELDDLLTPDGVDSLTGSSEVPGRARTSLPGTKPTTLPTVAGAGYVAPQGAPPKLPKLKIHGMIAAIENPRGTIRTGGTLDGKRWAVKMPHHYGFLKGVIGADGEEIDCFIGTSMKSEKAFVVNQVDADNEFDEHKLMLGFDDLASAVDGYMASFSEGWDGLGSIVETDIASLKQWMAAGNCNSEFQC